jgi:multidrug resistance protein
MQVEKQDELRDRAREGNENGTSDIQNDYQSPFDLTVWRKWVMTVVSASITLTVAFGSSVFSSTTAVASHEFDVSETIMILGVSLYVLGFAVGPIVWGPLSEFKGRQIPLFGGYFMFAMMQIPVALTDSLPGILTCRFLAGCFGAAPVVIVPAIFADIWHPADRGTATAGYAAAVFAGPTLGPIIGSLFTDSHLGWRWTAWITLIMAAVIGPAALIFVPETYGPVLRERGARKRRRGCGESTSRRSGGVESPGVMRFVRTFLIKPALMLVYEPMVCSVFHGTALAQYD